MHTIIRDERECKRGLAHVRQHRNGREIMHFSMLFLWCMP